MCRMCGIKNKVLCALLCMGLLSGCSGENIYTELQELDQMELVETMGADREDARIVVCVSTNAGTEEDGAGPTVLRSWGGSVVEALEAMPALTPKRFLFFGHTKHFVLGQAAAEEGIAPYMDYVERVVGMRLDTDLFIAREGSAQEIIMGEQDVSAMLDSVGVNLRRQSEGYVYNFNEVAQSLVENGAAMIAAVENVPEALYRADAQGEQLRFAGYAMIRDGKLAAFSSLNCARGINLLTDKVQGGILTVPDGQGGNSSLRLTQSQLSLEPRLKGDQLDGLCICLQLEMNLEGLQHGLDVYDPAVLADMEAKAAALELEKVREALALAQSLQTDFYGLGKRLELEHNKVYRNLEKNWEELFPTLDIAVQLQVQVVRSYDIGSFVEPAG